MHFFDARAWVLPKEEVVNYFIYRQQDAIKNSVSMVAQNNFKHSELQGLNGIELKKKLKEEKDIDWKNLANWKKRGSCIIKETFEVSDTLRKFWCIDKETPLFIEYPNYINNLIQ